MKTSSCTAENLLILRVIPVSRNICYGLTTASALNLISEYRAHICNNQIEIAQICVAHFWYNDYKTKERRVSGIMEQPLNEKKEKAVHRQVVIPICEWTGTSWRERNCPSFKTAAWGDSNWDLSIESLAFYRSATALHKQLNNIEVEMWNFHSLWIVCFETSRRFDLLTTDLGHALVVCDLTQILAEGSGYRWGPAGIPDHDSLWGRVVWWIWPPWLYVCATPVLCIAPWYCSWTQSAQWPSSVHQLQCVCPGAGVIWTGPLGAADVCVGRVIITSHRQPMHDQDL